MSKNIVPQFDKDIFKLGVICRRGHTFAHYKHWNLRYINGHCVKCSKQRSHNHYLNNLERHKELTRKWYLNNLERHKENNLVWKIANLKHHKQIIKNWRIANPERNKKLIDNWKLANPERLRLLSVRNRHNRRARERNAETEKVDLQLIYDYFNNECCYCGTDSKLTLEHIKPIAKGGGHTLNNLAIACLSCNSSKQAKTLFEWYNNSKSFYTFERFVRIAQWLLG